MVNVGVMTWSARLDDRVVMRNDRIPSDAA